MILFLPFSYFIYFPLYSFCTLFSPLLSEVWSSSCLLSLFFSFNFGSPASGFHWWSSRIPGRHAHTQVPAVVISDHSASPCRHTRAGHLEQVRVRPPDTLCQPTLSQPQTGPRAHLGQRSTSRACPKPPTSRITSRDQRSLMPPVPHPTRHQFPTNTFSQTPKNLLERHIVLFIKSIRRNALFLVHTGKLK